MKSGELPKAREWVNELFNISDNNGFTSCALKAFSYQYHNNLLYKQFCDILKVNPNEISDITKIPFLPISFFKTTTVKTSDFTPSLVFKSSGTSGQNSSRHYLKDPFIYEQSFHSCFRSFYGSAENYCILALLPSYLERQDSSLVYMVKSLMELSSHPQNGFYLTNFDQLSDTIKQLEKQKQKTILFGVTYALLDFSSLYPQQLKYTTIIETGGMKGRRNELIRTEVHDILKSAFNLPAIHSEYGMTELLSQAYSKANGIFYNPPWMKVLVREEDDPFSVLPPVTSPQPGVINIIDLANIYSCCFIATDDIGRVYADNSFEVLGRLDNSDIRGCSLLAV